MTLTTYKWSIEEWHKLVETGMLDNKPVQLLEGEIIEMSPEGIEHSYTNGSVVEYLRELFQGLAHIREAHPITLNNSEPEPDVAIVRLPKTIYRHHHPYTEDIYWLIEIAKNTLKIDLENKSRIYASNGIPEYWVIDLINKKLVVYTQTQNNSYTQITEYKNGVISSQSFPEISIALDQLLLF